MVFSYTQIAHYLRCPRSYRLRYLDGWREKETRAAMIFGRCFEKAIASSFLGKDCGARLFDEWSAHRETPIHFKDGESWDKFLHQGIRLLEQFARDNRIRVPDPDRNLQLKVERHISPADSFVAFVDAIGEMDGTPCLIDWKTTSSRYSETPQGLLALDPQLLCYSWITGIAEVAFVVFVRKSHPEIQYLRASISDEQRKEFGALVHSTVLQIQSAQFASHPGIRFPQNGCITCPHLGLCLGNQQLIEANLIRNAGANELAWLNELVD